MANEGKQLMMITCVLFVFIIKEMVTTAQYLEIDEKKDLAIIQYVLLGVFIIFLMAYFCGVCYQVVENETCDTCTIVCVIAIFILSIISIITSSVLIA